MKDEMKDERGRAMYTETPDIIPFRSPIKGEVLTHAELEINKIKTLYILNQVGVHFPSPKALDIFECHGTRVDFDNQFVRIPPELVNKAMAKAPRTFVLGGREERFDLKLGGNHSYISTDGTGIHVIDLETRQKRPSYKSDVALRREYVMSYRWSAFIGRWSVLNNMDLLNLFTIATPA